MAISRREISSLVLDLFRDSVFSTAVEPCLDLGIDRLNADRPYVHVTDHTVASADVAQATWGTVFDLPSGFDLGNDKIVAIGDLCDKGKGPDSTRNGIALSGTVHWMFDRGLVSLEDDGRILLAKRGVPSELRSMLRRELVLPEDAGCRPHPQFLRFHRETVFKG